MVSALGDQVNTENSFKDHVPIQLEESEEEIFLAKLRGSPSTMAVTKETIAAIQAKRRTMRLYEICREFRNLYGRAGLMMQMGAAVDTMYTAVQGYVDMLKAAYKLVVPTSTE